MRRNSAAERKKSSGSALQSITLSYDIVYCSSQDLNYPVSQIFGSSNDGLPAIHNESSQGWQSERGGKAPQTLVLRFPGNVWLQQIRILSHEAKIASKVEVRVYQLRDGALVNPPSFRKARFTKLGAVEFNSNEHSDFRSKERKTVHLKVEAYFLKLLFDRPYVNDLNTGMQIGVYSIECIGHIITTVPQHADREVASGGVVSGQTSPHASPQQQRRSKRAGGEDEESPRSGTSPMAAGANGNNNKNKNNACYNDANVSLPGLNRGARGGASPPHGTTPYSMCTNEPLVPEEQQQQHRRRQENVRMAPHEEVIGLDGDADDLHDFQGSSTGAMMLSALDVPSFRSVRIQEFEDFFIRRSEELLLIKEQATAVEDFEVAVECRDQLGTMNERSRKIYQLEQEKVQAIIEENFEAAKAAKIAMDVIIDSVYRDSHIPDVHGRQPGALLPSPPPPQHQQCNAEGHHSRGQRKLSRGSNSKYEEGDTSAQGRTTGNNGNNAGEKRNRESNRTGGPAAVAATGNDMVIAMASGAAAAEAQESASRPIGEVEKSVVDAIFSSSGENAGMALPKPSVSFDTRMLQSTIGPFVMACLLSRKFKLRESAILVVMDQMATTYRDNAVQVEDALLRFFDINGFGLQDAIPNVVFASCAFIRSCVMDVPGCIASVAAPLTTLIPRLLTRASDPQTRLRDESLSTLALIAKSPAISASSILACVLADPLDRERRKLPSTHSRAQLAHLALLQMLVEAERVTTELPESSVVKFFLPCLNHQSAEVRDLATGIVARLVEEKRLAIKEKDLRGINNAAIREAIQEFKSAPR